MLDRLCIADSAEGGCKGKGKELPKCRPVAWRVAYDLWLEGRQ